MTAIKLLIAYVAILLFFMWWAAIQLGDGAVIFAASMSTAAIVFAIICFIIGKPK